ncbi:MAG: 1-phosphofructokinase family hexose kinase [Chloroflexi bacterium]|nr:1-phosphofructokinase family hexose kinase [Chloroflexota bacterium]
MDKIVTLTMNPALDVGTRITSVAPEIKLRCATPEFHPGGGGINVSRAIHFLGGESIAVYAAGGHTGAMLTQLLGAEGIKCRAVPIAGITRESFVVYEEISTLQYRFTMPGPELSAEEWIACLEAVFNLEPDIIVASGSLPAGVPAEFYGEITRYAAEYGIRAVVDTAGEPLHRAFGKGVYLMKPNLRELELFAGENLHDEAGIKTVARRLIAEGLSEVIVVSMGAAGAALITANEYQFLRAPIVKVQSKVGAGDSMVAGLVMGLAQGWDLRETLCLGIAAGSAAVMTPGTQLCGKDDAFKLYRRISDSA